MDVYRKETDSKTGWGDWMKENICTIVGVLGGFVAMLLGGWDTALIILVIFMAVDFITGIIGAALGKSKHSWTGKLSSKAGWYGLAKKFCTLIIVVAVRVDILIGTTYVRDATCIGFCLNELLHCREHIAHRHPVPGGDQKGHRGAAKENG